MIKLGYSTHSRSKKKWETLEDIHVILSDETPLLIPKGFRNDLSSVPRFLWWFMPPFGKFLLGAIVHDYMYFTDYKRKEMGTKRARKFADEQMLFISDKENPSFFGKIDNRLRYIGVRWFGSIVYKR